MHALAITEQGSSVHAEGDTLVVYRGKSVLRRVRVAELDQVLLFGRIELSSGAMILLLRRGVDVVLLTQNGRYRGRLVGRASKNVALRLAQYRAATDPAFCLGVARHMVAGKIRSQRQVLLRAQRRLRDEELAVALGSLRMLLGRAAQVDDLDVLRGLEGQAAAVYFGQFAKLIRTDEFRFHHRTRRPPRDPVNAMLSFGYAVLGSIAETEVLRCGLDPMLGFFHQPAYGRPSLMLDVLEEFRPLVDGLVLRVVNRRQLRPADFEYRSGKELAELLAEDRNGAPPDGADAPAGSAGFSGVSEGETTGDDRLKAALRTDAPEGPTANGPAGAAPQADGGAADVEAPWDESPAPADNAPAGSDSDQDGEVVGVYLGDVGRKVFLNELFRRLRERLHYPPRDAALELRDILRQQVYHLARVIEAKQDEYEPFAWRL